MLNQHKKKTKKKKKGKETKNKWNKKMDSRMVDFNQPPPISKLA